MIHSKKFLAPTTRIDAWGLPTYYLGCEVSYAANFSKWHIDVWYQDLTLTDKVRLFGCASYDYLKDISEGYAYLEMPVYVDQSRLLCIHNVEDYHGESMIEIRCHDKGADIYKYVIPRDPFITLMKRVESFISYVLRNK